jgi:heme exporter protein CcmD
VTGVITGNTQWLYVAAAYGLTLLVTAGVLLQSMRAMKSAEKRSDALKNRTRRD